MTSSTVFCQQLFARRQEQRYIHSVSLTSFLPAFPCLFAASALFLPFFLLKFKYMSIEHIQQVQVTSTLQAFYCILFVLFYFLIFLFSFVRLPVRCTLYFVFCVWRKIGNFLLPECKKREKKNWFALLRMVHKLWRRRRQPNEANHNGLRYLRTNNETKKEMRTLFDWIRWKSIKSSYRIGEPGWGDARFFLM